MKYVVGDIHGEKDKLESLMIHILNRDNRAEFIFIGDYIDKGAQSLVTLFFLERFSERYPCVFLWGNHEYLWYHLKENPAEIAEKLFRYGARATIQSCHQTDIFKTQRLLLIQFENFFSNLKPYWMNESFIVTHSGIQPQDFATPPEDIPLSRFLFNRYDFIKNEGLYLGKYKVIFGHTAFYSPYMDAFKIGIDTAACYAKPQPLSALCLDLLSIIDSNNLTTPLSQIPLNLSPNIVRHKIQNNDK